MCPVEAGVDVLQAMKKGPLLLSLLNRLLPAVEQPSVPYTEAKSSKESLLMLEAALRCFRENVPELPRMPSAMELHTGGPSTIIHCLRILCHHIAVKRVRADSHRMMAWYNACASTVFPNSAIVFPAEPSWESFRDGVALVSALVCVPASGADARQIIPEPTSTMVVKANISYAFELLSSCGVPLLWESEEVRLSLSMTVVWPFVPITCV